MELMRGVILLSGLIVVVSCHNSEPQCEWHRLRNSGEDAAQGEAVSLECRVRTINNADVVLSNLTSTQMDRITSFHLECSDVLFFESNLENSFLTQLRRLQELKLEYCKIRYIPVAVLSPSRELRHLTLRTHNRDWSAMTMLFHADSFRGLPQLKFLDLSDNNIWSLPKELFCPLHTLTHLNLSSNRLQNVLDLGFSDWGNGPSAPGKACNVGLELLDLANNEISSLPDNAFTSLRSLQKFYLQNNVIGSIADRAFRVLVSLQYLDISNNRLTGLPPELFQSTRNLKEVHLFNNSISVLAPGLLEGLDQLVILDLSHNELNSIWVNKDTFSGLIRLVVLNLGYNQLTKIDAHVFQDLYSMQILDLEHNRIESIADGSFSTLSNLHALKLSYNRLVSVDVAHFTGVFVINQLFLDHNRISVIDHKTFENCSNLHDLGLYGNDLAQVPEAIKQLHYLKTLDLGGNRISSILNSSFQGLEQLTTLILSENQISNITKRAFGTLPSLRVLNLGSNRIRHIDNSAFGNASVLHAIRLDANQLESINDIFAPLQNLVWLNISDNQIHWFDYSFIPLNLEWLDMHKNRIENLGNYIEKRDTLQIKMLDVSFNRLSEISDTSVPDSVESLFLNNNLISKVKMNTFLRKANLSRVVLVGNQIRTVDMNALRIDPVPEDRELPQFYISENPFVCDCTMEWLQSVNTFSNHRQYPKVMDIDSAVCHVIYGRGQGAKSLMDLKPSQFLCPYESHCFPVCECCEYDACDCEMTCPSNCSCYHDHLWTSNIVDCSNAGYTQVPSRIPMDATEIYLDGNDLVKLDSHVFIGKKKLQILYLNDSNVSTIQNKTFNGVEGLKVLHLENNVLQNLEGFEFKGLEKLTELYLENNMIKDVSENTFSPLKRIEVLRLEQNKMDSFAALREIKSSKLSTVALSGNAWSCDCSNIRELVMWLKETNNILQMDDVVCGDGERSVDSAVKLCTEGKADFGGSNSNHESFYSGGIGSSVLGFDYVPFMAASLLLFIVVFLVSTLAFIFKNDIKLWLHSRYGVRILPGSSPDEDSDRLFDAYMVYSIKDEEFVSQIISASLERLGYSLCLHYRDMHVSPAYLTDSLLGASDASKRIILVLSLSFLQNEWERPLFKSALQTCLERNVAGGRRIISILTSNNCMLSPDLQTVLNCGHVLSWGEKRFWEKLRYLMPDVRRKQMQATDSKKISCDGKMFGDSARYTTAPTSLDTWYKMSPTASLTQSSVPTQSSCVSEESSQRTTTDDDDELANQHSYMTIDYQQRHNKVQHHVYSSIPDPIYNSNGRTYFV